MNRIISRNKSYVVQDKKTNQGGDNIGRIVIMEFKTQEVMGHADVSTTMNIYAEANPDVTKSVIEKLSKNMDIF